MPKKLETTTNASSIDLIVDGSAFKRLSDIHSSDNIFYYGSSHGYEYPVKMEIFRHIRSEPLVRYMAAEPIYYVAVVQTDMTNNVVCVSGAIPRGYRFYVATYNPTVRKTCDWRDEISIRPVIFGPKLLDEILSL